MNEHLALIPFVDLSAMALLLVFFGTPSVNRAGELTDWLNKIIW
jgi:hypothetical protein